MKEFIICLIVINIFLIVLLAYNTLKNNSNSSKLSSNKKFITRGHTHGIQGYQKIPSKPPKGGSGVPPKKP